MSKQELEQNLNILNQENENQVVNVKIADIYPNNNQPRLYFDEDKVIALCESIKKYGVLQPIVLKPDEDGKYMIIAGERRYRASIMAKKDEIPAVIKDIPIKEVMEIALVENLQRENLNIIEEAKAYKNLIEQYKSTQEELAVLVGKSRPYITNTMRLLNLSKEVKKYIELDEISPGHGKALLRISDEMKQIELAQKIIKENLSVRKTEEIVKNILEDKKNKNKLKEKDIFIKDIEDRLMNTLGTKVNITSGKKKGKIEIEYYTDEDLNDIIYRLLEE
ncbi:MAG: ParB/RepB/Spo0J family partition protein [Intestinibacter bartlettii]|uniref:ParB/RepB/Spo0J family partition protein n=1 Tax=Intestinibacter bartlettii TaxID=261299 RepID=UPI0026F0D41F|nr:ParB/RepB/Spo0J family partition protein [Intestinibacter bartlettii]MDO5009233.1 ParB/RepB/Spo0J family partition protein [Intestinibacter bartlettii]